MPDSDELIDAIIRVQAENLAALVDLSTRFVVDRVKQEPGSLGFDPATGALLGALSEAAKAARLAIDQKIILKGGEPGHGL